MIKISSFLKHKLANGLEYRQCIRPRCRFNNKIRKKLKKIHHISKQTCLVFWAITLCCEGEPTWLLILATVFIVFQICIHIFRRIFKSNTSLSLMSGTSLSCYSLYFWDQWDDLPWHPCARDYWWTFDFAYGRAKLVILAPGLRRNGASRRWLGDKFKRTF